VLVALTLLPGIATGTPVHHELRVTLEPAAQTLRAEDTVTLPAPAATVRIALHAGLEARPGEPGVSLARIGVEQRGVPTALYTVTLPAGASRFTLRYAGAIRHPVTEVLTDGGRALASTPGLIGETGAYLDSGSGWYPDTGADRVTLDLTVDLPSGWEAVSQGAGTPVPAAVAGRTTVRWVEREPQDGIFLVAGPYQVYRRETPRGEALVYLREADESLAGRYLEATGRYLDLYSRLIGPYPYAKFALVENFWETGYGMPSFTLLGPTVVRLPFILHTSYPHEVLHNWWGNSVYIDYGSGNWAEGLTSYLADHLLAELRGEGAEYRRGALQKYADYVAASEDFPLTAFRARHGEISQAVGYNKTLMVFHMLRRTLGDAAFVDGLRQLYADQRGRAAAWADVRRAFGAATGRDLGPFFSQWVERAGAPSLRLEALAGERTERGWRLRGRLLQTQTAAPYRMVVPVAVQLEGEEHARVHPVELDGRAAAVELDLPARPLRVQIDPEHDLFRRFDPAETPPAFGRLFGAGDTVFVLPSAAPRPLQDALRGLARRWGGERARVALDRELARLPADRPVWVMGWDNRWQDTVAVSLARVGGVLQADRVQLGDRTLARSSHAVALALPPPGNTGLTLGWVGADDADTVAGIGRKLPHYGRFGHTAFALPGLENVLKGEWSLRDTPLNVSVDPQGAEVPVRLASRPPLTAVLDGP
jgi:hypothetical protein